MPLEVQPDTIPNPNHAQPAMPPEADLGVIDFLAGALRWKTRILMGALIGAAIGAIVAFVILRPVFTGRTSVMIPQQRSLSLPGQLAPLAALAGRDLGLRDPSDLYITLLKSRSVSDALIERYGLQQLYEVSTLAEAREQLASKTLIQVGKDGRVLEILFDDHEPARSAEIANAYVDALTRLNDRLAISEAAQRRKFFETRLDEERALLAEAEEAMRDTMTSTGMLEVSAQTEALVRAVGRVRAEIAAREVSLERLLLGATEENPEVKARKSEIASLRTQLAQLEARTPQSGDKTLMPVGRIPQAGLSYMRRLRDVKYHEALFEILAKEFEIARIDESKEGGAIQVVDRAEPPDRKSGPPRALIVLVFGILGPMLVLLVSWIMNGLNDREIEKISRLTYSSSVRKHK